MGNCIICGTETEYKNRFDRIIINSEIEKTISTVCDPCWKAMHKEIRK